ncbi:three component ABC system middle component, partial [Xenorhabdus bovienii]|uniref:three component ABC system middle component n=1 Tax=Xenorhabdus bovienii TaxID=40576 RepID=UPI003DA6515E
MGKTPIVNNPALGCFILTYFVNEYHKKSDKRKSPSLNEILLILPMIWHAPTRGILLKRRTTTNFQYIVDNDPLIFERLSERVSAYSKITFQSLNIAVSTNLLVYNGSEGVFQFLLGSMPYGTGIEKKAQTDIIRTVAKLASWFK